MEVVYSISVARNQQSLGEFDFLGWSIGRKATESERRRMK